MKGSERKFLCDEMLGALAKWLRMLGHDASYARDMGDTEILKKAKAEGRLLLTRDGQLAVRAGEHGAFIRSPNLDKQLAQMRDEFGVRLLEDATRCSHCGVQLRRESREEAEGHIPAGALEHSSEFYICPGCGRRYWNGTHWQSILLRAERLGLRP
jgi:uncharacterized protein with PIN domain